MQLSVPFVVAVFERVWRCSPANASWVTFLGTDVDIDTPRLVAPPRAGSSVGGSGSDNDSDFIGRSAGLTDEQRAAKVEELRKKIAQRKVEQAIAEKVRR